jgi:hypothetical protein
MYRTDKAVAAMKCYLSKKLVIGFAYEVSSRAELQVKTRMKLCYNLNSNLFFGE